MLDQTFIDSYPAGKDIIGQIFAAYPSLVQMVSPSMLDPELALARTGNPVEGDGRGRLQTTKRKLKGERPSGLKERIFLADYLHNAGIGWLMIVGGSFAGHLYWVTLYRDSGGVPFSDGDRETFQYLVPLLLLRFHRAKEVGATAANPSQSGVPPLSPSDLQLALMMIQGRTHRQAGKALNISPETVKSYLKKIRAQLKIPRDGKLTLDVIYHGAYDLSSAMAKNKLAK